MVYKTFSTANETNYIILNNKISSWVKRKNQAKKIWQHRCILFCGNNTPKHLFFLDPRVEAWPLMSSPIMPILIVVFYLYVIYRILPNYMENRKPFDIKKILIIYNAFQMVSCSLLMYGVSAFIMLYSVDTCKKMYLQRFYYLKLYSALIFKDIRKFLNKT